MNEKLWTVVLVVLGFCASAVVTWLSFLTLEVFDLDRNQAEIRKDDSHLEYRLDQVEDSLEDLEILLNLYEEDHRGP